MEVKTCEEYVLARLEELQEQNDDMRQRLSLRVIEGVDKLSSTCEGCEHYVASAEFCRNKHGLLGDVKPTDYCSRYEKREVE